MPKLSEVGEHANIEVLCPAQVETVEGEAGNFRVTIRERARYVTDECTRCDLCSEACPQAVPNEFDVRMATRKAIYTPMDQAEPSPYIIDLDLCLNEPPNYFPCDRCVQACGPKCIDFFMPPERVLTREVSAIIVAVGFDLIDPALLGHYGYGKHPDVLTSMEFERMLASMGPTGGEIVKPSNGEHPKNIFFVLCVGSRDRHFYRHCSRFCCMYSIKETYQALTHGVDDVTVLYMDVRAYGKGFDAFFDRTRQEGAKFIRGHPAEISPNGKGLIVRYENTDTSRLETAEADMVVLATAVRPSDGMEKLAEVLGVELDEDGFLKTVEDEGGAITTTRPGIFAAGCSSGPKDIPDSVAEGSGAAASALIYIDHREWPEAEMGEPIENVEEPRIGVFVCHCGSNIASVIDVEKMVEDALALPDVVHAQSQMYSCAGNQVAEIADIIHEKNISRVVVAACSPKTHEPTFRRACRLGGLNPYLLEMVNLRNHDSWVHADYPEEANDKGLDLIRMGVDKARLLQPLEISQQPVVQKALVIGGGIAGMTAAANLAQQGYETHLVEKEAELGGMLRRLDRLSPAGPDARELVEQKKADLEEAGVHVHTSTEIEHIGGVVGSFNARLTSGEELEAGAVVLAMGARPYQPTEFNYGQDPRVVTNVELAAMMPDVPGDHVTFIGCVGSRTNGIGCCRYGCTSMIGQALELRRAGKKVRVLYRDIRTFSREAEEMYEEALREGVQFFRYDPDSTPDKVINRSNGTVSLKDDLTGAELGIPTDLLVLTIGLQPQEEQIADQLKVSRSEDGFLLERHPKLGPAEAPAPGIYLAGTVQYPKDVRESIAQALAAASNAGKILCRDTIEKEPITAQLVEDKCIKCGICVPACPYGAIELIGKAKEGDIIFHEAACQACGNCAAICNYDAVIMPYFTKEQMLAQIDAALADRPQEKCIVFTCNWCSYPGADQAGIEKIQYPPSSRIIRTMCSARIEEEFVARAFEKGAGAVLITGCRLTASGGSDCHYNYANEHTKKRFEFWHRKLTRQGIEPDRLQLHWNSASQGKEWAAKMREMDEVVKNYARKLAEGVASGESSS
jgi:heterodisulfide reductase subunit A